jgi:alkanesulfonate monooxygenase SsuD/methylene tetrahydromethanopterin reductase-like flavin-dependent oxidoreductase (luciferase family)
VAALAHNSTAFRLLARVGDVGFVTPKSVTQVVDIVNVIRREQDDAGRADQTVHVFGDLVVLLDEDHDTAASRQQRLDDLAESNFGSDALIFAGTPRELADLLVEWRAAGLYGFRLRPAALPHDLVQITDALVPELQRRGLFRTAYPHEPQTLRERLDLPRAPNRYAVPASSTNGRSPTS